MVCVCVCVLDWGVCTYVVTDYLKSVANTSENNASKNLLDDAPLECSTSVTTASDRNVRRKSTHDFIVSFFQYDGYKYLLTAALYINNY